MKTAATRKHLRPEDLAAIIDTREQLPLDLSPLRTIRKGLKTGDYSLVGLEEKISCERKSLQDLIGCVGRERERFDREIERLKEFPVRAIFVEGSLSQIEMKMYRGDVHPNAVIGSVMGWMAQNIPIFFVPDHKTCGLWLARFLYVAARRFHREGIFRCEELDELQLQPERNAV